MYNWEGKTILIVEDDKFTSYIIESFLQPTNVSILTATSGITAVDLATTRDVDLVLMDIRLPDIDGIEATRRIKADKPNLPIIAQTAFATDADVRLSLQAGCDGYLSKPIIREKLLSSISKFLGL